MARPKNRILSTDKLFTYTNLIYLSGLVGVTLVKSSVLNRDLKDASEMLGCFRSGAKKFQQRLFLRFIRFKRRRHPCRIKHVTTLILLVGDDNSTRDIHSD